jgi:hypothetical protein
MKNFIIVLFICSLCFSLYAQNLKETDVPSVVREKFSSLYPNITSYKWEKENGNYEAAFKENGTEISVIFDAKGTLIQTEVEIPITALPKGVSDYTEKNLPAKKISEASKITDTGGKISYEAEISGHDYLFDENGNFTGKTVDSNDTEDDDK